MKGAVFAVMVDGVVEHKSCHKKVSCEKRGLKVNNELSGAGY